MMESRTRPTLCLNMKWEDSRLMLRLEFHKGYVLRSEAFVTNPLSIDLRSEELVGCFRQTSTYPMKPEITTRFTQYGLIIVMDFFMADTTWVYWGSIGVLRVKNHRLFHRVHFASRHRHRFGWGIAMGRMLHRHGVHAGVHVHPQRRPTRRRWRVMVHLVHHVVLLSNGSVCSIDNTTFTHITGHITLLHIVYTVHIIHTVHIILRSTIVHTHGTV